ncbi:hypothetical protein ABH944_008098 [Caballeronia udeis]|jgi:hypothetical protein|uniref:Uncharacterized protein n=1 Tax=Caballeronia udeis TaxID=1232866 RepID=A0ABW8MW44_9BURK
MKAVDFLTYHEIFDRSVDHLILPAEAEAPYYEQLTGSTMGRDSSNIFSGIPGGDSVIHNRFAFRPVHTPGQF